MKNKRYFLYFFLITVFAFPTLSYSFGPNGTQNVSIFLPLISNPATDIQGRVTWAGNPAGAIELKLRFYNGNAWSTISTTQTKSDGTYKFENIPSLQQGQLYYVRYDSPTNDILFLRAWLTPAITTYEAGSYFNFGEFDIGGILLAEPASGAYVNLPCTFLWNNFQFRPNNNNSYEFNIYDFQTANPYFYTNVGTANVYTMNTFPSGFKYDVLYLWEIWVYDSIGGFGISNNSSQVRFSTINPHLCHTPEPQSSIMQELNGTIVRDHPAILLNDLSIP